jgi:hypothetical protein
MKLRCRQLFHLGVSVAVLALLVAFPGHGGRYAGYENNDVSQEAVVQWRATVPRPASSSSRRV